MDYKIDEQYLIETRRHFHQYPELSLQEFGTAKFIRQELERFGIAYRTVGQTGALGVIHGRGEGKTVLLRADIDALPIAEAADVEWKSRNEGVMHACGHDVHAAVLFGTLQRLAADPSFGGTVFGLFQPGEECNPGGASVVLAEEPFDGYDVRAVVGEHTDPSLEVGVFGFREGRYMASSDELRFTVKGRGGHAAMRNLLRDAVAAQAALVTALLKLNSDSVVLSIGRVQADGATNVVPDSVYMEGTLRAFDEAERELTERKIEQTARLTAERTGVEIEVDINRGYPCVVNDPQLTRTAAGLAGRMFTAVELGLRPTAEDFGFYCRRYPSLFYRLGVGTGAGRQHTPHFAPDEAAIDAGVEFMTALARKLTDYGKEQK